MIGVNHPKHPTQTPLWVEMVMRCRRCDPCRRQRSLLWQTRAKNETAASVRTWFGTLTLRPDMHHYFLAKARSFEGQQGVDFDALPVGEQLVLRHKYISPEITRYLKRIRKQSSAPLRYLCVMESHKSGLPHYHMLVHEQDPALPVRHKLLTDQWLLGFTVWKLCPLGDVRAATYLCKYLSKSTAARVRASVRYGQTTTLLS